MPLSNRFKFGDSYVLDNAAVTGLVAIIVTFKNAESASIRSLNFKKQLKFPEFVLNT